MSGSLDADEKRRWRERLRRVDALLDLPAEERIAHLAGIADPVERELLSRLVARSGEPSPLDTPAAHWLAAGDDTSDDWDHRQLGRQVGPFTIERPLGRGGMGTVFLASRTLGEAVQRVALKLLPAADSGLRRRFAREQRALAALSHPAICPLVDAGETEDGTPWLAMAYVDGVAPGSWCERRQLDARGRVALLRPVADALAAAHRGLFVHRDIKPSNLLVDHEGILKIVDFNLARTVDEAKTHGFVGTRGYAAPEQYADDDVTFDEKIDVYALGICAWALLHGDKLPDALAARPPKLAKWISEGGDSQRRALNLIRSWSLS